jgi:phosphate-selective porin
MKRKSFQILLKVFIITHLIFSFHSGYSQEDQQRGLREAVDTLNAKIENLKADHEVLKRLRISGYIQAQWQLADTNGIHTFEGGNFPKYSDNRFMVRRGRLKFTYDGQYSQFVIQIDATEKGVTLKDAYLSLRDPWLEMFTLTGGVFDRPFGFEISYSSSLRESPERSRIMQTLFPGERDLGAKLTIQPNKLSRFNFIKLDLGLIGGNGPTPDNDSRKDFLGHLTINRTTSNEKFKYGLGVSYYYGGYFQETPDVYDMETLSDGSTKAFVVDSSASNVGEYSKRIYYGADAQFSVDWLPGITTLRGEYIWGNQPGPAIANISPIGRNLAGLVLTDTYNRPFQGGYVYFIQNIGASRHSLLVKYDWFDPNTEVKGEDMQSTVTVDGQEIETNFNPADIMYTTWGFGYNLRVTSNVKLTAYYALVKNESTGLKGYTQDLKDNVLTLRLQFKF